MFAAVAAGCPLPVLQHRYQRWLAFQGLGGLAAMIAHVAHVSLLPAFEAALGSSLPDWREKCEYLLTQKPLDDFVSFHGDRKEADEEYYPAAIDSTEAGPYRWAAQQPDYAQRLRYLYSLRGRTKEERVPPRRLAAEAAAAWGREDALIYLLDECGLQIGHNVAHTAARAGQLRILQLLRQRRLTVFESHPDLAGGAADAWPLDVRGAGGGGGDGPVGAGPPGAQGPGAVGARLHAGGPTRLRHGHARVPARAAGRAGGPGGGGGGRQRGGAGVGAGAVTGSARRR
ncbi:hypothetical protein HYH02_013529 [Chlamydomonas schloesseri]|uniref:Uncharacterized protein n=1 Tax=Chlamydomonas schloesseri TaxID=2026947 RepID=A0A835SW56_9CHLO|nr:hypothetical protein HYH02_013529 [Chlamydomonas schloesseri]|eukprot:KAG2430998.1 hypothetical protein HYH02_013529 [Chlamydomonas schloesseri]